ncbi:MAG: SDR family NAD(P)-dependent oxidoreductase [Brachybacterium sp.]|uniref:SDR family oxidoreductase n=1 Tax=Brachybacterium sp. TaxID=1891286 RepID=UPI0026481FBD|nr:SDR family NAD(P)-dependent oxidoreductase [Brachybacterium sp.]MDN5600605.1 SDR family NAD(P)-dependent oxidoreductase [Brachybacterium sp.]MDN5688729.1 SDR family NAD(P)-dependent oxidoreductase [Brachybacterium sp.]
MQTVSDITAFITGGASGIGLGMARAFAAEGAKLALADLDETGLDEVKRELDAITEVITIPLDVRDREAMAGAADRAEAELGPVRLLCNNAGVGSGIGGMNLETMSYEHWDHTLSVNLGGVVNGVQTFVPRMVERGGPAHVVNTSSGSGLAVTGGAQFMYCASKYAVTGLSEAIVKLLKLHGIGLTLVSPGFVDTRIAETTRRLDPAEAAAEPMDPAYKEKLERFEKLFEPLGQDPDEVGRMVLDAIHNDQLYCQPDRLMAEPIRSRSEALLGAMPAETERDRKMAEAIEKARR